MAHKLKKRRRRSIPAAIPVEKTNLTPEERALLPDPAVLTEDDADALAVLRSEARGEKGIPFREYLRRRVGH